MKASPIPIPIPTIPLAIFAALRETADPLSRGARGRGR